LFNENRAINVSSRLAVRSPSVAIKRRASPGSDVPRPRLLPTNDDGKNRRFRCASPAALGCSSSIDRQLSSAWQTRNAPTYVHIHL